ncbi:beta-1,3-galactosyltransferase 1-like [Clavelina lepadiformis]|uniref:beta-1,3-galactosyltransferase 1-like n=1 Tax=Clavelina lepadiformis TaxID=159417 RepID=UPI004041F37F
MNFKRIKIATSRRRLWALLAGAVIGIILNAIVNWLFVSPLCFKRIRDLTLVRCGEQRFDGNVIAKLSATKGIYMQEMPEERSPISFLLRPTAVEEIVENLHLARWNMVYLVKSAVYNWDRRDAIRRTWGSEKVVNSAIFQVVFVLGKSVNGTFTEQIQLESEEYGDILLCNETDSAQFVSEKVVAGMQWASEVLPENWLYASIDDDFVVNPSTLTGYLDSLISTHTTVSGEICFGDLPMACVYNYQSADPPARDENSKWYMPFENYPGNYWPVYCRGGMYTTSSKMVKNLFEKSKRTAHLYLDDVWITGFMRRKLNKGDYNIVPAPLSVMSDRSSHGDHALATQLVKHLWGNINDIKVNVTKRILEVWKTYSLNRRAPMCG